MNEFFSTTMSLMGSCTQHHHQERKASGPSSVFDLDQPFPCNMSTYLIWARMLNALILTTEEFLRHPMMHRREHLVQSAATTTITANNEEWHDILASEAIVMHVATQKGWSIIIIWNWGWKKCHSLSTLSQHDSCQMSTNHEEKRPFLHSLLSDGWCHNKLQLFSYMFGKSKNCGCLKFTVSLQPSVNDSEC